ncbi:unnamed protein product [Brassicogethes aeneus]|uniref:Uncharacterized protein n=1 Tax=Brassicogethes aeneus TaxID=1431903 RepID=A0A9P0ASX4_BRAAE|nr:unnamed protein product [Brassicogethes aeneus]
MDNNCYQYSIINKYKPNLPNMFKFIVFVALCFIVASAAPKPGLFAAPLAVAPAVVTAESSQVVARNFNALVAAHAPVVAAPAIAVAAPIAAVLIFVGVSSIDCSGVFAHGPVFAPAPVLAPAVRYAHIAPQAVSPFAAQVSTFTKGLNVYAAPYAAGVLSGPAIAPAYPHGLPYPAVAPAPGLLPAPVAAPAYYPSPYAAPGFLPSPYAAAAYPHIHAGLPASPLLPSPFARSVHAVAPALAPAPLLG